MHTLNPIAIARMTKMYLFKRVRTPVALIHFVTNKCNMKCKHCFYWKKLNKDENNLSLNELEKIICSFKQPLWTVIITGGEPFLLPELPEICKLYSSHGTVNIHLLTNGFLEEKIVTLSEELIKNTKANIHFQISIDGLKDTHDKIRGTNGSFDRAVNTINKLKKFCSHNHTIHILTVLSKLNFFEIRELSDLCIKKLKVPIAFELARGTELFKNNPLLWKDYNPEDKKILLNIEEMEFAYTQIKQIYAKEKNLGVNLSIPLLKIKKTIEMLKLKKKVVDCVAGNTMGVIYPDGKVSGCELIEPFVDIKDYEYDFEKLWQSEKLKNFRNKIINCYCSHGCFLEASLASSLKYGIFYNTVP